jgi:large subunit ribosomal protein L4
MASKLFNIEGKEVGAGDIKTLLIDKVHKQCMFEQVVAEDAGKRQATASTLTRGEVRGGGKKPRAQKHTGRAQMGSIRASNLVGGGCAFGPKPNRNYKLYLNDKQSHLALKSAFTLKDKNNAVFVLEDIKIAKPETKKIIKILDGLKINKDKRILIIGDDNKNLITSARNINKTEAKN